MGGSGQGMGMSGGAHPQAGQFNTLPGIGSGGGTPFNYPWPTQQQENQIDQWRNAGQNIQMPTQQGGQQQPPPTIHTMPPIHGGQQQQQQQQGTHIMPPIHGQDGTQFMGPPNGQMGGPIADQTYQANPGMQQMPGPMRQNQQSGK